MSDINLIHGDCLEKLKNIPDKSINLVLIDPPYNIGKDKWDKWKSVEDYVEFMGKIFLECQRVLKDNGSFYFFHNDFLQMVELQNFINKNTNFKFKQLLVWDKFHGSEWNQLNAIVYNDKNRNYSKQAEYCLFYTFQNENGLENKTLFKPVREYLRNEMKKANLNYKKINELLEYKSNGGGYASHYFTENGKQWGFITEEHYRKLQEKTVYFQKPYEELKQEYEELKYVYNNQNVCSILQHEPIKQNGHLTPKPIQLLEILIKTSSNENDIVLDCFMGSGSTGVACKHLNRRFIGIEINEKYFKIAKNRIELE